MASHAGGWAPGTLVRFGSLDFIVTIDEGLERIQIPTRPDSLEAVIEVLLGLRLRHQEEGVLLGSQRLDFDSARLGRQLRALLGPRSTQEDLCRAIFSLANVAALLTGGEPFSPDIVAEHPPRQCSHSA